MVAAVRRCGECGAAQAAGDLDGGRCVECRAALQLAPPAVARGPAGWCREHPGHPVSGVCAGCGAFTCTACDVSIRGIRYCERCRGRLRKTLVAPVAWEERRELGRARSWWRTTSGVISRPDTFFDQLHPTRDLGAAVGYALLGALLHQVWWMLQTTATGGGVLLDALWLAVTSSGGGGAGPGPLLQALGAAAAHLGMALLAPLATFGLFAVVAAAQHAALRVVGAGGEHGLPATLKVALYALGGTGWLGLFPVIGALIQVIWWTVLMINGTARVHQCSTTRSLVVVLPMALFCGAPLAAATVAGVLTLLHP